MRTDWLPRAPTDARSSARFRLRAHIEAERRRRRSFRARGRIGVVAGVVALVLALSPVAPNGDLQPLLGLADALAVTPPPIEPVVRHWYTTTERMEFKEIPVEGATEPVRFWVTVVEEIYHDGTSSPRRTLTYGEPTFDSYADQLTFERSGIAGAYGEGTTQSAVIAPSQLAFVQQVVRTSPDELGGMLRRTVAGLGDRQQEEVQLLRLTADLMHLHANDPLVRAQVLRVIADIPGIAVSSTPSRVAVSFDYVDGDRPLRLVYEFDAETAHLVEEQLAVLASVAEPEWIVRAETQSFPIDPD